jgi:hypothetical protein
MALFHSPSIVRNGLSLYLDAANTKSYNYSENLFTNSNDFTVWSKQSSTATSLPVIALNTTTTVSPAGTFNAALYTTDYVGGSTYYSIYRGGINISSATYYTYSVYMKAKEVAIANLSIFDGTYNSYIATNLNTGAITYYAGTSSFTTTNYTMIPVGNGWYRAVFPFSHSAGGNSFQFKIDLGSVTTSSGIYLYGAQIQKNRVVGEYTPTTASAITPSTTWADLSGNGINITPNGTFPTYQSSPSGLTFSTGYISNASTSTVLNITNNISIDVWVNQTTLVNYGGIIVYGTGLAEQWSLNSDATYGFSFGTNWPGTWYLTYPSAGTATATNKWINVVVTFASGTTNWYINGNLNNTVAQGISSLTPAVNGFVGIGNNFPGGYEYFAGAMSIIRVYNRVISATEVSQNFQAQRDRYGI